MSTFGDCLFDLTLSSMCTKLSVFWFYSACTGVSPLTHLVFVISRFLLFVSRAWGMYDLKVYLDGHCVDSKFWIGMQNTPFIVILIWHNLIKPIPVAALSKAWACLLGERVRILPGACISVPSECCILSDRGLCAELFIRPEEFYRMWCVWMWSWSLDNEEVLVH
jgi:hypothetical protein